MVYEKTTEELVKNATRTVRAGSKGKMGIVRCHNYRCLAVQGKDGKWRDALGTELQVVEVVTLF